MHVYMCVCMCVCDQMKSGQFHHDGGFSASSQLQPMLVMMTCEEAPDVGGETCFFETSVALREASDDVLQRARKMRCVYIHGFGRVEEGKYPLMSTSWLVPTTQSPQAVRNGSTMTRGDAESSNTRSRSITEFVSIEKGVNIAAYDPVNEPKGSKVFKHMLVQPGGGRGRDDFVLVHCVCLDHLEEQQDDDETWTELSWKESQEFLEKLLTPAAHPSRILKLKWQRGDICIFDNLRVQHSVTPTDIHIGKRRLVTRTAMQPQVQVLI